MTLAIMRSPTWLTFLDGEHRLLWLPLPTGAEKGALASTAIRIFRTSIVERVDLKCSTVYYYCSRENDQDEAARLLRWLIGHLWYLAKDPPVTSVTAFNEGRSLTLFDLLQVLSDYLEGFGIVYLAVVAVEKCAPRLDLLGVLIQLASDPRFIKLRILAISQRCVDIEQAIGGISECLTLDKKVFSGDEQYVSGGEESGKLPQAMKLYVSRARGRVALKPG